MSVYVGLRLAEAPGCVVYVIDAPICRQLPMRVDVRNHSPCGFEWGYAGSGPAQLALALLCDVMGDAAAAQQLYQRFKFDVVSQLPKHGWTMTSEYMEGWILDRIGRSQRLPGPADVIELGEGQP